MAWLTLETIGLICTILFLLYYYSNSKLKFWQKRGVKGPKPLPFFGNFLDVFFGKASFSDCFAKAYYEFRDEPLVGVYAGHVPLLVLRDPELMKDVLVRDFANFPNRTPKTDPEIEILSDHLFNMNVEKWKPLRAKLTPIFSSGKLKEMFHSLVDCSDHFEKYLAELVAKGETIECREISAKFTIDAIGSCIFGIEMNALTSENSEFCKLGRKVFQSNFKTLFQDVLRDYPFLFKIFGYFTIDRDIHQFFIRITKEAIHYRSKHNVYKRDFIDTLIDLKRHPDKVGLKEVNDTYLAAQFFVFFNAGFETSSMTIANTLYELALCPSIQEKLRAEIKNVLQRTNGVITFDCIKEMKYLDACFKETLRKYPLLLWLSRTASEEYSFRGTKITIPKGQPVFLPVYAIHRDPKIYPDPDVYDPQRFMDGNNKSRYPTHFLPFGDGPRNCIGVRFARNQTKLAIIKILSKFKIETCEKTCRNYTIEKKSLFLLQLTHGLYVKMSKLEA